MFSAIFRSLLVVQVFFALPASAGSLRTAGRGMPAPDFAKDTSLPYVRSHSDTRVASAMVYFHLACLSARLKLYPLAMKLFLKSALNRNPNAGPADSLNANRGWCLTRTEDSLLDRPEQFSIDSKVADMSAVLDRFRDTADVDHYALILQVKQPVFNKRKVFTGLGNVGHTFITLIRFNRDDTYLSRSFGFYPKKRYPLAASPVFPATPGLFRDDADHDWDEMAGRFISKDQFRAIIHTMEAYAHRHYHLSKNNCTDFGLTLAALGGIQVKGTASRWPLGRGNNPAWTGQSILLGDVAGVDSAREDDIFITLHHPEILWGGK